MAIWRTEVRAPYGLSLQAWGDFNGHGVWTFQLDGKHVDITYDWNISAEKPLLRYLSFILKLVQSPLGHGPPRGIVEARTDTWAIANFK